MVLTLALSCSTLLEQMRPLVRPVELSVLAGLHRHVPGRSSHFLACARPAARIAEGMRLIACSSALACAISATLVASFCGESNSLRRTPLELPLQRDGLFRRSAIQA